MRNFYFEIAKAAGINITEKSFQKLKKLETDFTYSVNVSKPESRDQWFFNLACEVATYSSCHSRKIGAVLVRDKSVISTGYNGPPRGVPPCDRRWELDAAFKEKYHDEYMKAKQVEGICPRRVIGFKSGYGLDICPAGHAERNALINAARFGIETKGTTLYMTCGIPCTPCLVEIINAGVDEIVVTGIDIYDSSAEYLLNNSDLKIRFFDFMIPNDMKS